MQEILPLMGQYEIQNSSILAQESEQITYYNSEKQTYLVSAINLENESQGVWMVRHFQDHYMAEYYRYHPACKRFGFDDESFCPR